MGWGADPQITRDHRIPGFCSSELLRANPGPTHAIEPDKQSQQFFLSSQGRSRENHFKRCHLEPSTVLLLPQNTECFAQAILELQQCAFHVIVAHDFKELEAACIELRFHVAVMGPALGPRMKKAVALLLQQKCPHVPVIEIAETPVLQDTVHLSSESGPEFMAAIKAALPRP